MYDLADLNTKRTALEQQLKVRDKRLQRFLSRAQGGDPGSSAARVRDQALGEVSFILFTTTDICASPANDLTCPPSYIIIFNVSNSS